MRMTPKEQEKLLLHMAGNLAKERKGRGLKLNYAEAVAYISSDLMEMARDGKEVTELMQLGTRILSKDDVMEGVADMIHEIQVEATFPGRNKAGNGTQSNTVRRSEDEDWRDHAPGAGNCIKRGERDPTLLVANTGDRPYSGIPFSLF